MQNGKRKYLDTPGKRMRRELHERFLLAFGQLSEQGIIKKKSYNRKGGDSYSAISEVMFGRRDYGHVVVAITKGKQRATTEQARLFAERFGISTDWLLNGTGGMWACTGGQPTAERPLQPEYDVLARGLLSMLDGLEPGEVRRLWLTLLQIPNAGRHAPPIRSAIEAHLANQCIREETNRGNAKPVPMDGLEGRGVAFSGNGHQQTV